MRVDVGQVLSDQGCVRVSQDFSVAVDQEGVAHAVEVQGIDRIADGLQVQVRARDA